MPPPTRLPPIFEPIAEEPASGYLLPLGMAFVFGIAIAIAAMMLHG